MEHRRTVFKGLGLTCQYRADTDTPVAEAHPQFKSSLGQFQVQVNTIFCALRTFVALLTMRYSVCNHSVWQSRVLIQVTILIIGNFQILHRILVFKVIFEVVLEQILQFGVFFFELVLHRNTGFVFSGKQFDVIE